MPGMVFKVSYASYHFLIWALNFPLNYEFTQDEIMYYSCLYLHLNYSPHTSLHIVGFLIYIFWIINREKQTSTVGKGFYGTNLELNDLGPSLPWASIVSPV